MSEHLVALLEREIEGIRHSILNGACSDFVIYREQIAQLKAFETAVALTKKSMFADEEEDNP